MRHGRSSTSATLASRYVTQVMSCGFDFGRDDRLPAPGIGAQIRAATRSTRSTAQLLRRGIPMRRTTLPVLFAAIFAVLRLGRAPTSSASPEPRTRPPRARRPPAARGSSSSARTCWKMKRSRPRRAETFRCLFVDKTTLNIGPNSSLVIDHFVYDPKAGTGQVALSLGKGVLRVVGGFATHTGGATIATPAASIGLRGGIATIEYHPGEGVRAVLGYGHLSMSTLCRGVANCDARTPSTSIAPDIWRKPRAPASRPRRPSAPTSKTSTERTAS